ncbi:tetratricopeptide repeat-containing glycosyltransferase family 2 protein [Paenibacillus daejeonensis]|uniref:tetratricopeptide repeat-containing glycosyltransferase family 2 protein n=1 Tax=Paenibacillus daejeonensis TaxID=135193 RepID=UPI0003661CE2|nr:glycosyltransferase family 2 protein [Paenibacillus daejeonensis]
MIVKNEEHTLNRCLESVKGIPDEIIIVDTGSTDRTKEIAKIWTDHVHDYKWNDDFAAARNVSFDYATQQFILWLDADDILSTDDRTKLLQLKETLPDHVDAVTMIYAIPQDANRGIVSYTVRTRLVRREKQFRWKGVVHEDLTLDGSYQYHQSDIAVTHTKIVASSAEGPSRRNLEIYESHLERGYDLTISDRFHYARECQVHKLYERAIENYEVCMNHPEVTLENQVFAMHKLATCYVQAGQPHKELELTLQSLTKDVPYPAFSCRMGEHFLKQGHIEAAIYWYRMAYMQPLEDRYAFSVVDTAYHTWLPHQQLALCYDALGDSKKAGHHRQWAEFHHMGKMQAP